MKTILSILTLASGALVSLSAHAFAPTIFYGAAFFVAHEDCTDLGITKNESLILAADYTHFQLVKAPDSDRNVEAVFSYSVPQDGAYFFEGDAGLQHTSEFLTHAWSGQNVYDFKLESQTGDLVITHGGPQAVTTCRLSNNSGG